MKKYKFDIFQSAIDSFFPKERIKNKIQLIEILLEATRYMLAYPNIEGHNIEGHNIKGTLTLVVAKMSRLFFEKNDKFVSFIFPFYVSQTDDKLNFTFQNINVNSRLISNVISIIKSDSFKNQSSLDFANPIYEIEIEDEDFWVFFRELILLEDGYIRYDKDAEGYNQAKKRGEEHKHPENHYDLYYSNNVSFKIGLENAIELKEFIDLLDVKTGCKYLKK